MQRVEKPDFRKIYCFECDTLVSDFYGVYFLEKGGGLPRYGAICKKCLKCVNSRKIVVLSGDDLITRPGKVVKDAFTTFRKKRRKHEKA